MSGSKSGQVRSGQVGSSQVRSGQVKLSQVKLGQARSSQVKSFFVSLQGKHGRHTIANKERKKPKLRVSQIHSLRPAIMPETLFKWKM